MATFLEWVPDQPVTTSTLQLYIQEVGPHSGNAFGGIQAIEVFGCLETEVTKVTEGEVSKRMPQGTCSSDLFCRSSQLPTLCPAAKLKLLLQVPMRISSISTAQYPHCPPWTLVGAGTWSTSSEASWPCLLWDWWPLSSSMY